MKKMLTIPFLLISLMLTSCAAAKHAKWNAILEDWKGQPEDQIYLVYGAPHRTQKLHDGRKIVMYDYTTTTSGDEASSTVTFGITNNVVTTAKYDERGYYPLYRLKPHTAEPIIE